MKGGRPTTPALYEPGLEGLYLLPGDIALSAFETRLADFWAECFRRYETGYLGTTALSSVVSDAVDRHEIDFVFYDTGPNVGPLNRVILLDCDYFIIPAACDLFSMRALKTLGLSLLKWTDEWATIRSLAPDDAPLLPGEPQFLGYIPQKFRTYGGAMTEVSSQFYTRFRSKLSKDFLATLRTSPLGLVRGAVAESRLGMVKDFASLVQLSQEQGTPLWHVHGGNQNLKREARDAFGKVAQSILSRVRR